MMTYQAHCAVAHTSDLWSILAQLGGGQLRVTSDLANDFLDLVHGICCVVLLFEGGVDEVAGVVVMEGEGEM